MLVSTASAPASEVAGVDLRDHVRLGQVQDLGVALLAPEIVQREVGGLDLRAHGPIEDQDPFTQGVKEVAHVLGL